MTLQDRATLWYDTARILALDAVEAGNSFIEAEKTINVNGQEFTVDELNDLIKKA